MPAGTGVSGVVEPDDVGAGVTTITRGVAVDAEGATTTVGVDRAAKGPDSDGTHALATRRQPARTAKTRRGAEVMGTRASLAWPRSSRATGRYNRTTAETTMNDDTALVRLIAAGDRQAFASLYDRYASRVYALAVRMLGESMAAEEVTQDAFLKLWSRSARFDPERGNLLPWLLTIARRTALDRIRLESRRPAIAEPDEEDEWDDLPDGDSQGEEARWRSLRFEVAKLPADQRKVIELAYYHGMTHSQIASELGLPLGTVKTRLRVGMERLREKWLTAEATTSKPHSPGVSSAGKKRR